MCSSTQSMALRVRTSERTNGIWELRSNCWRTVLAGWPTRAATASISASRSSSSTSIPTAVATARRARSTPTERWAATRSSTRKASGSCPVSWRYWASSMPWARRRRARSWRRVCISVSISASGGSASTSLASSSAVPSRTAIWACEALTVARRVRRSSRSSSTVENSEASAAKASSRSGRTVSRTSFSSTVKSTGSSPSWGWSAVKVSVAPALAPRSSSSSSGTIVPAPTRYW